MLPIKKKTKRKTPNSPSVDLALMTLGCICKWSWWNCLFFFGLFFYWTDRSQRADRALHQTAHGQDADAQASQLAHPSPGAAEAARNPSQTQGRPSRTHGPPSFAYYLHIIAVSLLPLRLPLSFFLSLSLASFLLVLRKRLCLGVRRAVRFHFLLLLLLLRDQKKKNERNQKKRDALFRNSALARRFFLLPTPLLLTFVQGNE